MFRPGKQERQDPLAPPQPNNNNNKPIHIVSFLPDGRADLPPYRDKSTGVVPCATALPVK
jgi:hypothetical protein